MVEFWKPCLVLSSLVEQEQASSECFLERNRIALREIFAWCIPFWRKKYSHLSVAPEPLAISNKELEGLLLKSLCFFIKGFLSIYPGSLSKKSSGIARSGFFLSWYLEVIYLKEVFLVMYAFFGEKMHSLSVAPEPLAIWNKKLEGLESYAVQKSWKSSPVAAPERISGFFYSKRTWVQGLGIFSSSLLLSDVVVW